MRHTTVRTRWESLAKVGRVEAEEGIRTHHRPCLPPLVRITIRNRQECFEISGVVNQHIQSSETLLHLLRRPSNSLSVHHIHHTSQHLGCFLPCLVRRDLDLLFQAREIRARTQPYRRSTGFGVGEGGCAANAFRGTSDEDMFTGAV